MATIVRPDTKKYASGNPTAKLATGNPTLKSASSQPSTFKPPSGQVGIREWLRGQGYADNDITYNNGKVSVKGTYFASGNPLGDGRIYGNADDYSKALQTYRTNAYGNQLDNTLNTIGQKANAQPYKFQEYKPFSYNPDTDPTAQALRARYQQDAGRASNNAMVSTGSRGIGNSSATTDRVAQIQQQAATDYNATAIPALQQQAYQQYAADRGYDLNLQNANYGAQRDQIGDLNAYANALNGIRQQGLDNAYRDQAFGQQQKNDNMSAYLNMVDRTGNLGKGPSDNWGQLVTRSQDPNAPLTRDAQVDNRNYNYQVGRDRVADAVRNRDFQEDSRRYGLDYALRKVAQQHGISMDQAQLELSRAGVDLDILKYGSSNGGTPSTGPSAGDISMNINRAITGLGDSFDVSTPAGKQQVERMIVTQTSDPVTAIQLYNMYGITVPSDLQADYNAALKKANP